MDVWIGTDYAAHRGRILVLGESWYTEVEPLVDYVPKWANKAVIDQTFSRLFNAASGTHTERASTAARLQWWNSIAFYNFVTGSVGPTRDCRPTHAAYEASKGPLADVLRKLQPHGVWIVGVEQAGYSTPVIAEYGALYEIAPHTASWGLRSSVLVESWKRLCDRLRR